ncbi:hypothetical protein PQQ99_08885 [Paraburkholderia sediminicola]|uniref:hypothetical protein n=1 Tax=Paraburkholderia sediminicola TaxID=458836 RepID=UPI0038BDFBCF
MKAMELIAFVEITTRVATRRMMTASGILLVPFVDSLPILFIIFSITLTGIASTTSLNLVLLNDLLPSSKDVAKAMAIVVVGENFFGMVSPIATDYVIAATGS